MSKLPSKPGKPPGIWATQLDLQRQLCEHLDNRKVIEAVYRIALDDEHKH